MFDVQDAPSWVLEQEESLSDLVPLDPMEGLRSPGGETFLTVPDCPCCYEPAPAPMFWDIPGHRFGDAVPTTLPCPSPAVAALQSQVARLVVTDPVSVPAAQAVVDARALLEVTTALRTHNLSRLADVHGRQLHDLADIRSASSWLGQTSPDTDSADLLLGRRLHEFSALGSRLSAGALGLGVVKRVAAQLSALRQYVDRADRRIDGQPSDEVMPAVVRHVVTKVAECRMGLTEELHAQLSAAVEQILAEAGTELRQLERAFTLLAEHIPPSMLKDALAELADALLPNLLEKRAAKGEDDARLSLERKADGSGWHLRGDLDLETGELLSTALAAEARRDEANAQDTAAAEAVREQGLDPYDRECSPWATTLRLPRRKAQRLHDALRGLVRRYLASDLAGSHDKQPVRVSVTVSSDQLHRTPGALPAVAGSGARLPRRLLARWWCDATVTAFLMSRTWVAVGVTHTQRTLTATERNALDVQSGGHRCAGVGCCRNSADPTQALEPHHVHPWAQTGTTSLLESVWACPKLHHDLHHGRTVELRSGRRLNASGWVD